MTSKHFIFLCGMHSLAFGLFHLCFPLIFKWKTTLKNTTLANRAILNIENGLLTYLFLAVAALCFIAPAEMLTTRLGFYTLLFMAGLWIIRCIQQFIWLRINRPAVHVLTLLFITGAILFSITASLNSYF